MGLTASKSGVLHADDKRAKVWILNMQRRYQAAVDDMVIGIVQERFSDEYRLDLNGVDTAVLPSLAFEGASKKNKPNLVIGSAVFCRIVSASRQCHSEPEASCIEPGSSRSWTGGQTLYGELKFGNIVDVSLPLAKALTRQTDTTLKTLGARVPFQSAVGLNGRVWIQAADIRNTVLLSEALKKADVMEHDDWFRYVDKLFQSVKS